MQLQRTWLSSCLTNHRAGAVQSTRRERRAAEQREAERKKLAQELAAKSLPNLTMSTPAVVAAAALSQWASSESGELVWLTLPVHHAAPTSVRPLQAMRQTSTHALLFSPAWA